MPLPSAVRHFRALLEADLLITGHVSQLVSRYFRQLMLIRSCIQSVTFEAAKTAIAFFVGTQVDRCNSLRMHLSICSIDCSKS